MKFRIMSEILEDFQPGELLYDKTKYRLKFDVHFSAWNPNMDLLALASKKGNIIVKRLQWKTGWKVDFDKQNFLSGWWKLFDAKVFASILSNAHSKEKRPAILLVALCWSPNGEVLATAFDNGNLFFLDAQTGRPLFFTPLGYTLVRLRWFACEPATSFDFVRHLPIKPSSSDFNFFEGAPNDSAALIGDLEAFFCRLLSSSLLGTLLCVVHTNNDDSNTTLLDVLAGGFLCVKRYNLCDALAEQYDGREDEVFTSTLEVLDVRMNRIGGSLSVLCKYCAKKEPNPFSELDEDDSPFGYRTSMLDLPFDFSDDITRLVAEATFSVSQLALLTAYVREMFAYSVHDWQAESEAFHRRVLYNICMPIGASEALFNEVPSRDDLFALRRDFLTVITTGVLPKRVQNFCVHESVMKDLRQANAFVDKNFTVLFTGIYMGLRPAVMLLMQHLRSLVDTLEAIKSTCVDSDFFSSSLSVDDRIKTRNGGGASSYDALNNFRIALTTFDESLVQLASVAEENRRHLKHFVRFLLTLCLNQSNEINDDDVAKELQIHKVDLRTLSNFISRKFGNFDDRPTREKSDEPFSEEDVEFVFLESFFDWVRPLPLTDTPKQADDRPNRPMSALLDDVLAVLQGHGPPNSPGPLEALDICASHFRSLLRNGICGFIQNYL